MTKFMRVAAAVLMLGFASVLPPMSNVRTAELNVLAGGSTTGWLVELAPHFERAFGHKLVIHFDSTPNLIERAVSGAPLDVAVVPVDLFKDAGATARFVSGPTTDIARVGYGVIVRAGAPKPDISTPDALKQTLLGAQSVALLPKSAAGAYVLQVFERLGIAQLMNAKTRAQTAPARIAEAVAKDEAELGVFLVNVLMAPGVELAGTFPPELQQDLVFTAAVSADSKEPEAAKNFISFLKSPAAATVITAKGMNPA
ncbi:MAG TPA: substrate-binding domain-containing protein [Bradyrhizobium sp.]|uniref:molybdate ABC transporter substrate-binding protein n=1 Tax=Bradyrhizobium sp. TaxID=376 RepID=UPI002B461C1E|nr:substrate-binding domain-containing protein [Bradyrhizobium sp.]HKO72889.1 substrate-binding domain-containing protein [Bradyrhizobium sp.]